jgi:membrane fusion protein, multidrug efflux system
VKTLHTQRGTIVKTSLTAALLAVPIAALVSACAQKPPAEPLRAVRTAEVRYDAARETNRYFGSVQARYEVNQAFRVGGKIVQRRVDVGQTVRAGDVIAVLDDSDYRLAVDASNQAFIAATTQARQAESDRKRLEALKADGSVSVSDEEQATSRAQTSKATAEAEAKKLALARNRLEYTVLRASQSGVVTAVKFEVGQVVAEGQAVVSIANPGEPEIVVDVPEDRLATFKAAHFKASLASAPGQSFDVALRELSPEAAAQTRTYRARLKPVTPRALPLGATATLVTDLAGPQSSVAVLPSSAVTQSKGQPALWVVHRQGSEPAGTVELMPVAVQGYRSEEVLVAGLPPGTLVVTAGVQKMAPGLRVALPGESLIPSPSQASAK